MFVFVFVCPCYILYTWTSNMVYIHRRLLLGTPSKMDIATCGTTISKYSSVTQVSALPYTLCTTLLKHDLVSLFPQVVHLLPDTRTKFSIEQSEIYAIANRFIFDVPSLAWNVKNLQLRIVSRKVWTTPRTKIYFSTCGDNYQQKPVVHDHRWRCTRMYMPLLETKRGRLAPPFH